MKIIVSLIFLGYILNGYSQVPEFGGMAGGSYYIGDLNPTGHFENTKFSGGIFYRNQIKKSKRLSFRFQLMYGKVEAFDSKSESERLVNRNLNFQSKILEIGPLIEFHYLKYEVGSRRYRGTPYLFLGLTYFKMNPMGQYEGNWIELQSLGTEGQGTSQNSKKPYNLNQLSIPVGVGVKFNLSSRVSMGIEYGVRKTFTDYLDDVSGNYVDASLLHEESGLLAAQLSDPSLENQNLRNSNEGYSRGNAQNKDWYYMFGISLSFRLFEHTTCAKW